MAKFTRTLTALGLVLAGLTTGCKSSDCGCNKSSGCASGNCGSTSGTIITTPPAPTTTTTTGTGGQQGQLMAMPNSTVSR